MAKGIHKTVRIAGALAIFTAIIAPSANGADVVATTLVAPKEIKAAPLPFTGIEAAKFTAPTSAKGLLTSEPTSCHLGDPLTIKGTNLPANTPVNLVWGTTAQATWKTEVTPATVNYLGVAWSPTLTYVDIATITTDSLGNVTYKGICPEDFGGAHDVYAVINGEAQAKGGISVARTFSISPNKGPIGTKFTVTYTGMGYKLYGSGGAVLYDNKYAGELQARWTRGTAKVTMVASGPVGPHYVSANAALTFSYLNIIQSPNPEGNPGTEVFTVTKDNGVFKPTIDYPTKVTPTVDNRTTMALATNEIDKASSAVATLTKSEGVVGSKSVIKVTGLPTTGTHNLVWSTVVGNRFNCPSGTCWVYSGIPLATAEAVNGGFEQEFTVPDHLGGWHVIQVMSGSKIEATVMFYVKQSVFEWKDTKTGKVISYGTATWKNSVAPEDLAKGQAGVGATTFKEGQDVTLTVKGVGWTQMDNTLALSYDNAYIGYGCGFNSNGTVVFRFKATGGPGTHIINLRPLLYTQQPSFADVHFGMVPFLAYDRDFPGLALGYQIPMYTFAIKIVK